MKPVVAFDIGKVLLDFDYGILIAKLAPRTQWNEAALDAYLNQSPLLAEYESGQLTSPEFFTRIQDETKFTGTESEFAALFEDIFTPIEETIAMHRKMVERGVPTYTFSNTNEMAVRHISRSYDFWSKFTGHILSHEVKSLKPDAGIYESLEAASGREGESIIYLDDRPENIEAGRARGWRACCHQDANETQAFLQAQGVLTSSGHDSTV